MKKIAIFCGTFYFAPKPLKKSIWSIAMATKGHLAKMGFYSQSMPQMLFLSALGAK